MHVVRTPVDRAAAAIEAAPGTVEHAARGPGVLEQRLLLTGRFFRGVQGPSRPRKNLPEARRARMSTCEARSGTAARVDLTAPVKIYIIIIVQMHRNEHEFYCDNSLCRSRARARRANRKRLRRPSRMRRERDGVYCCAWRLCCQVEGLSSC